MFLIRFVFGARGGEEVRYKSTTHESQKKSNKKGRDTHKKVYLLEKRNVHVYI
jgi:hypothetical protein